MGIEITGVEDGVRLPTTALPVKVVEVEINGIVAAAAYSANDAFGDITTIPMPYPSGVIQWMMFLDLDDEGLEVDFMLCREKFTPTADNAAFAPADGDAGRRGCIMEWVAFATFTDLGAFQVSINRNLGIIYECADGKNLYCQGKSIGAPTIAAGSMPRLLLGVVP